MLAAWCYLKEWISSKAMLCSVLALQGPDIIKISRLIKSITVKEWSALRYYFCYSIASSKAPEQCDVV